MRRRIHACRMRRRIRTHYLGAVNAKVGKGFGPLHHLQF
jgi:hypothetical protein